MEALKPKGSAAFALLAVVAAAGCGRAKPVVVADAGAPTAPAPRAPEPRRHEAAALPFASGELLAELPRCDVLHEGLVVDFGTKASVAARGDWETDAADPADLVEHDGATWELVRQRTVSVRFFVDEPSPLAVAMRVKSLAARSIAASIDGRSVGFVSPARGAVRMVSTKPSAQIFERGNHVLTLRFSGPLKPTAPIAELDWVRVGDHGLDEAAYAAPTLGQIVTSAAIGKEPHRALSLRAPGAVRCAAFVAAGSRLRVAFGFAGAGEGDVEARVVRDGVAPLVVASAHVRGDAPAWTSADVPLDAAGTGLAHLELRATSGSPGGRVLFGDPRIDVARPAPATGPAARAVVVVVLSSLARERVPPAAAIEAMPALASFVQRATTFERHRAPTTVALASFATLVSGRAPAEQALEDAGARLPAALTTLPIAAREGSVQTAMFTGNPSTFEPFGLARGWDRFAAFSPVEGVPASAPLVETASWLEQHLRAPGARAIALVHARGSHPPWDVTPQVANGLPPADYGGLVEPRRSAQMLARARAKGSHFRLTDADRTRLWAIHDAAMALEDAGLAQIVAALERAHAWDDTLFVVTSDVGLAPRAKLPFGDGEELSESALETPLWVHFPGGALAGAHVAAPTTHADVARTALAALGLAVPLGFAGVDLLAVASGDPAASGRPLLATLGERYSLRWGELLLRGTSGKAPALCDHAVDPGCDADALAAHPLAVHAMLREVRELVAAASDPSLPRREPATIDAATSNALLVWGP